MFIYHVVSYTQKEIYLQHWKYAGILHFFHSTLSHNLQKQLRVLLHVADKILSQCSNRICINSIETRYVAHHSWKQLIFTFSHTNECSITLCAICQYAQSAKCAAQFQNRACAICLNPIPITTSTPTPTLLLTLTKSCSTFCQRCGLRLDVSVSRWSPDILRSRLGLVSTKNDNVLVSSRSREADVSVICASLFSPKLCTPH